jgi:hypothetical protein
MPCSTAHEAFTDELLFAVADVLLDEGLPLRQAARPIPAE